MPKPKFKRAAPPDYTDTSRMADAPAPVSALSRQQAPGTSGIMDGASDGASDESAYPVPNDWSLGQLLNVRNTGPEYVVTLLAEEFDWNRPERALRFTNVADCQNFVSQWYSRTYPHP